MQYGQSSTRRRSASLKEPRPKATPAALGFSVAAPCSSEVQRFGWRGCSVSGCPTEPSIILSGGRWSLAYIMNQILVMSVAESMALPHSRYQWEKKKRAQYHSPRRPQTSTALSGSLNRNGIARAGANQEPTAICERQLFSGPDAKRVCLNSI